MKKTHEIPDFIILIAIIPLPIFVIAGLVLPSEQLSVSQWLATSVGTGIVPFWFFILFLIDEIICALTGFCEDNDMAMSTTNSAKEDQT